MKTININPKTIISRHIEYNFMEAENSQAPELPRNTYSSNTNPYGSTFGMSPYPMYGANMGNPYMGGPGMFMNGGTGHLPSGLQQSISLLETVLVTIGSTTQLIESSYMAAKGIMHTFKEISHQAKDIKEDFKNTIRLAINFIKRVLLISKENRSLNDKERRSVKRIFMVICLLLGVPYLCKKIVTSGILSDNNLLLSQASNFNPDDAKFVRVLYNYTPEDIHKGELKIKKNQILAILSDTSNTDSLWWKARNKQGEIGYIPSNYVEVFEK